MMGDSSNDSVERADSESEKNKEKVLTKAAVTGGLATPSPQKALNAANKAINKATQDARMSASGLVINGEVHNIPSLNIINWESNDVLEFTSKKKSRSFHNVKQIIIHETLTRGWNAQRFKTRKLSTHLVIFPPTKDGKVKIYQHMDLISRAAHAGPQNKYSIGIDIVQMHKADKNTTTGSIDVAWGDGGTPKNKLQYELPHEEQAKAAYKVCEWVNHEYGKLGLSTEFPGIVNKRYVFYWFKKYREKTTSNAGIYAHGHIGGEGSHVDGHFMTLYLWLRFFGTDGISNDILSHDKAWEQAKKLSMNTSTEKVSDANKKKRCLERGDVTTKSGKKKRGCVKYTKKPIQYKSPVVNIEKHIAVLPR